MALRRPVGRARARPRRRCGNCSSSGRPGTRIKRTENQAGRGFAPEGDFRSIHPEDARIAQRSTTRSFYQHPGQKTEMHEPLSYILGKIDTIKNSLFVLAQIDKRAVSGGN
jgi:hypothetical protein